MSNYRGPQHAEVDVALANRLKKREEKKELLRKIGVFTVAIALSSPIFANIDQVLRLTNSSDELVVDVNGCPPIVRVEQDPHATQEDNTGKEQTEEEYSEERSVTAHINIFDINPAATLGQFIALHSRTTQEFTLPSTGMNIKIHSDDQSLRVDDSYFEELSTAIQRSTELINHPEIRQQFTCFKNREIDNREFEGKTRHVTIISDPFTCFVAYRLVHIPEHVEEFSDYCDSRAHTIFNFSYLIGTYNGVIITAGILPREVKNLSEDQLNELFQREIAGLVVHEAGHGLQTQFDTDYRWHEDEKVVQFLGELARSAQFPDGFQKNLVYLENEYLASAANLGR